MELHLRLRPRQRGRPLEGGGVAMLVDKVEHRLAGLRRPPSRRRCARWRRCNAHAAAQGEDRIEHRADRVGHGRPSITAIGRWISWPRPRKRARSVSNSGFPTVSPSTMARCAAQISCSAGERRRRVASSVPCVGEILRGDEQLQERRMRDVVGLRRQHELGIGRDVDLAHPVAGIRDRDAADLGVVFGRDEHFQRCRERSVVPGELGAILVERDVVGVGLGAGSAGKPADQTSPLRTSRRKM